MEVRTVGIIGHGAFGSLVETLIHRFAPRVEVRIYSSRAKPDGKRFFTFAEAAASDAIVLTVPIRAFEKTVKKILPLMREDAVIVDVATVKVYTSKILKRLAGDRRFIATHPMWGPESYEKRAGNVSGFRIVIAMRTLPKPEYAALCDFLKKCGFDVVEMTAEKHDKHLAETLFLTHFVGQIIHRAGFDRTAIDTISFGSLMDAVESVKNDEQLFKDVYEFNPYCKEVLKRFKVSEKKVRELLEK